MNKRSTIYIGLLLVSVLALTGCGRKAELKVGKDTVVAVKNGKITANSLYNELKKDSIKKLIDMMDHKLLDKKYPTDEKETKSVDNQIDQIKSYYKDDDNDDNYLAAIKSYFGVESEKELKDVLSLEYKRSLAVNDYIKDNIKDDEINKYYENNIYGDIKASHILISVKTSDDMSEEDKEKEKKKALEKANKVIKELNSGKSFKSLVKKYSDDSATIESNGDLGYFNSEDMDANFWNAALELEKGKYSEEPVESAYGYHIILKTGEKKKKSLDKVKDEIKETITKKKLEDSKTIYYESLMGYRESKKMTFGDKEMEKMYKDYMNDLIEKAKNQNNSSK